MMGRKFRITEEQYKRVMKEGVLPTKLQVNAQNLSGNNDPVGNVEKTQKKIKEIVPPNAANNFEVVAPNPESSDTQIVSKNNNSQGQNTSIMENKLITKKQLQESRLKALKENSEVYSVKDFIKKFNN